MTKPALYSFLLALVAIIGIIALAVTDHDIPSVLQIVAGAGVGGGLGSSYPVPPNDPAIPPKP